MEIMRTFWLTGLSGSGKTTLVNGLGLPGSYVVLDGDDVRNGLCSDLGFTDEDRIENIRRIIEVCKILNDNDFPVVCAFITPFEEMRKQIRKELDAGIVYVKCSLKECIERDPKGLYRKNIDNFTGKDSRFEEPKQPDLIIDTEKLSLKSCVSKLAEFINSRI